MKKCCFIILFLSTFFALAQAPLIDWQQTYGGDRVEALYSVIPTLEGGYIVSGWSNSDISGDKTDANMGVEYLGGYPGDFWIIKTDQYGEIEWQKTIGGDEGDGAYAKIVQTTDGGYIVGGSSSSNISGDKTENSFGDTDYWVVKLDSSGTVVWDKTIGGSDKDTFSSLLQTPDGGYLIGGTSNSPISGNKTENYVGYVPSTTGFEDYWIVKLNATGVIEWQKTIGGTNYDYLQSMINTPDGGFIIGGSSASGVSGVKTESNRGSVGADYWLLKLDNIGTIQWQRTLGGSAGDSLEMIINTTDGGYLIGGNSTSGISGEKTDNALSADGNSDMWVLKLDAFGTIQWQKTIGGIGNDMLTSIVQDSNGNFLLGGSSNSNISFNKTENSRGGLDFWVVKINSDGMILWDKTIGGAQSDGIRDLSYIATDNSYILGGISSSSNTGDKTDVSRGMNDYWIVKLNSDSLGTISDTLSKTVVFPNPTTKTITIEVPSGEATKVTMYSVLGQVVYENQFSNTSKINIDIVGQSGIYFVQLETASNERKTFKIAKK
jgi:hypothetical protein